MAVQRVVFLVNIIFNINLNFIEDEIIK